MDIIKNLFKSYFVKLVAILIVTMLISLIIKIYILSGIVILGLTLYVLIKSFKDPNMKNKKLLFKILIYFFIAVFLIDGIILLSGDPNTVANGIRDGLQK